METAGKTINQFTREMAPLIQNIITKIITYNTVLDILDILQSIFNPQQPCVGLITIFLVSKLDKDVRLQLVQEPAEHLLEQFEPIIEEYKEESKKDLKNKKESKLKKSNKTEKYGQLTDLSLIHI